MTTPLKINHALGIGRGFTIRITLTDLDGDPVTPTRVIYAIDFPTVLTLDSEDGDGSIVITSGVVTINVSADDTEGKAAKTYKHDALFVYDGKTRDLLHGGVTLYERVSNVPET